MIYALFALALILHLVHVFLWARRTYAAHAFVEQWCNDGESHQETINRLHDRVVAGDVIEIFAKRDGENLIDAAHRVVDTVRALEEK